MNGSYVKNCAIHHSFNRALTAHGIHDLLVEGNVAYDIMGHTYFVVGCTVKCHCMQQNILVLWCGSPREHMRSATAAHSAIGVYGVMFVQCSCCEAEML